MEIIAEFPNRFRVEKIYFPCGKSLWIFRIDFRLEIIAEFANRFSMWKLLRNFRIDFLFGSYCGITELIFPVDSENYCGIPEWIYVWKSLRISRIYFPCRKSLWNFRVDFPCGKSLRISRIYFPRGKSLWNSRVDFPCGKSLRISRIYFPCGKSLWIFRIDFPSGNYCGISE